MAPVVTVSAGRAHPPAWIPAAGVLPLMTPHRPMDGGRCRVRGALSARAPPPRPPCPPPPPPPPAAMAAVAAALAAAAAAAAGRPS